MKRRPRRTRVRPWARVYLEIFGRGDDGDGEADAPSDAEPADERDGTRRGSGE